MTGNTGTMGGMETEASPPISRTAMVRVVNEQGLHVRPCNKLLELMREFSGDLYLAKVVDGEVLSTSEASARSATSMLLIEAPCGTELRLRAVGDDAEELLAAAVALFQSGFELDEVAGR